MAGTRSPCSLLAALAACLLCVVDAQVSTFNVQGFSPDQAALLAVKRSIPNWDLYQQRSMCFGWHEKPYDDVCKWTSVTCRDGRVIGIHFQRNASYHLGAIQDVLAAASQIEKLEFLDLQGQAFSGTLPTQYNFPNLVALDLINNNIGGMLPLEWGLNGMFPKLANLALSYNPPLSGPLPTAWGSDNSSFQSLRLFEANNCNLTGGLPAEWAAQLPSLTHINISSNALTGTLPSEWSNLDLNALNLDRNALTGSLPPAWGVNGSSFTHLTRLSLYANNLTGTIPAAWAAQKNPLNGLSKPFMNSLSWMDVSNNMLSGRVPDFGTSNPPPYFIMNGNNFCGAIPQSLSVWNCATTCMKPDGTWPPCSANGTSPPVHAKAPAPATNISSPEVQRLLLLRSAFSNWAMYERTEGLNWTLRNPMCDGWGGVQCSAGFVTGLNFSGPDPAAPQRPPVLQGVASAAVHGSEPVALQGDLGLVLKYAFQLPQLKSLDLTNAYVSGSIPNGLSAPHLTTLLLGSNHVSGTLPLDWAMKKAVPALKALNLSGNYELSGPLPDAWGNASAGMQNLQVFSARGCNLSGPLPASWAGLPALGVLDMAYNYFTGSLPVEWQNMDALQTLDLVGNGLTYNLPDGWSSKGAASWPALRDLHLDANLMTGTLPASWGAGGSFPMLSNLTLANNNLSGSLPMSWGTNSQLVPRFKNLQWLTLLPGNPGLCGGIPPGLTVLQKTGGGNTATTQYLNDKPCSVSADTMVQSAPSPQSSSSPNLGAIIGGVVGGIAALAALAAVVLFFVLRNRRRSRSRGEMTPFSKAMPGDDKVDAHGYDEYDDDMQDSDKFIPPPKLTSAPASIVPFAQAPSSMGAALGAHSAHSTPTRGSDLGRLSSKDTSFRSKDASFRSQGSGYSSEPAREGDAHPETLPHMFNKDWELNLDALEIELDEDGREVELGKGAFGVVVRGRYRLSPVAVKRLINQTPEQQAQFLKEMAILRACRGSRYIVPFVGASLQPGNTILAMDFMENGTLWDQLPRTNKAGQHIFQWKFRGKKVAYEIALGLHCLHDLKVVHLDLKSSNVLIAGDGSAKISDVGLAALMSQNYLSQMAPAGTWSWVAPEVILGGKVTNKADIYSFGVVIWEICTLERPAWRGNLRDIKVPEEAPQEIADLVLQCTGEPEARPTAEQCAELIGSFLPMSGVSRKSSGRTASGEVGNFRRASGGSTQPNSPACPAPRSGGGNPPKSFGSNAPKSSGSAPP
ncbi:hypothetical protein CVIRNUC_003924 [Coccomyxa viridis]|uniref:Protein kinase domain-containing protein n=1 Tax=Coccomyxa viridis TaxID=1274662 RepID=A0AAV1HZY9_9CHLO|nr:hypothetical protein CVIRNUC_003924 [Coccomyxa viridis]